MTAEPVDPDLPPDDGVGADDAAPEERRYPSTIGGAFYLLVLLSTVGAIVVVSVHDWRLGVRMLAGALAVAAGARLVLPQRDAGMLAVRHRLIDVGLLAGVAVALFVLAGSIPDQPPL